MLVESILDLTAPGYKGNCPEGQEKMPVGTRRQKRIGLGLVSLVLIIIPDKG
jgi:hypothetical protein